VALGRKTERVVDACPVFQVEGNGRQALTGANFSTPDDGTSKVKKMKRVDALDRAELIKWMRALDMMDSRTDRHIERALQMARECRHPDAQWLMALLPDPGVGATRQQMVDLLEAHGDDPRASHLAWKIGYMTVNSHAPLRRAAEMGYAPAEADMWKITTGEERFAWCQRAAANGNRHGLYLLACSLRQGNLCEKDEARAMELFKESAELEHPLAQVAYGELVYRDYEYELYVWLARAALGGWAFPFCNGVLSLLPSFENGASSRILHTVAPYIRKNVDAEKKLVFGGDRFDDRIPELLRVVELHEAILRRAKEAIVCAGLVILRLGVVKDIRVMIGKMAWEDAWRWGTC
jgi:hypothetical protein